MIPPLLIGRRSLRIQGGEDQVNPSRLSHTCRTWLVCR